MSLQYVPPAEKRTKLFVGVGTLVFALLIAAGIFAKNGWFPSPPDPFTGKRTGWFGRELPKNAGSNWNPFAAPLPSPTPQLSREYIHAGSRLLSVVDANAQEAPPADLAVWRPTTGTWWVMGGPGSQQVTQTWGQPTDKPVPGDYDGDGKTDFSVFRPSTGEWYYLQSSDHSWGPVMAWGNENDVRVPADFDGDGRTDRAVWRPGDGIWYIVMSSTGASSYRTYGISGDVPAPADYDGDGRADLAVYRHSDAKFHYLLSSQNNTVAQYISFGQSGDVPVPGDYDGDGRADAAVWRGGVYQWHILYSSNGTTEGFTFGDPNSDVNVANDYDGDGKCDRGYWRPSEGKWYIAQSSKRNQPDEIRIVQWGIPGDIPVPAFYRR